MRIDILLQLSVTYYKFITLNEIFPIGGDFTLCGQEDETKSFISFMEDQPHQYKIVIGGTVHMCMCINLLLAPHTTVMCNYIPFTP